MLFFKSLAAVATIALGALSVVAAPALVADASIAKKDGHSSIPQIIADVTSAVTPIVQKLEAITAEDLTGTSDVLSPIISDLKTVLSGAISEVNGLVLEPVEVILASVDGTAQVTVTELAQIISNLLHLVLGALGHVLTIAKSVGATAVVSLLTDVGGIVGSLVQAILGLVGGTLGGLAATINSLVSDITSIISGLNITVLASILGINLGISL